MANLPTRKTSASKNKKETEGRPNKSQAKRELNQLKDQAEILLNLSSEQIHRLSLQPALLDALKEMESIKHPNARKRHLQYITKLLLDHSNIDEIKTHLSLFSQPHLLHKRLDNQVNKLVSELIDDNKETLTELLESSALENKQNFLQILRNAKKEFETQRQELSTQENESLIDRGIKEGKSLKQIKKVIKNLLMHD